MKFKFEAGMELPESEVDLLAVGELLVDLIAEQETGGFAGAESFGRHFGGSPANIALNVRSLGLKTSLISRVGEDGLGDFLLNMLKKGEVDIKGIKRDRQENTSIILITQSKESPEFLAYRGAEKCLKPGDIDSELIGRSGLVHISTFAISAAESRRALDKAMRIARDQGKILSLDPNYRPQLWEGDNPGHEYIKELLKKVNIVKPSLDDARALFGPASREEYIRMFHNAGADLVILTLGADGLLASTGEEQRYYPSLAEEVKDTTGAGDAFWSGFYAGLIEGKKLSVSIQFGNALAAEALKMTGAPLETADLEEIEKQYEIDAGE